VPTLTVRRPRALLWLPLVALAPACAPTLVAGTMSNPARTTEKLQSSQEYDIGPYKENHRYYMTLKDWTPAALGVEIKVVDFGDCAKPASYDFTLVDDAGGRQPSRFSGDAVVGSEKGRSDIPLVVSTISGTFDVTIGKESQAVTILQRPRPDISCPSLDWKWSFQ
jgi:hypothetical protein